MKKMVSQQKYAYESQYSMLKKQSSRQIPLMCIDMPLGSTTTLEFGLDGLVTLVTVPLTGVGGLEELLPTAM